MLYLCKQYAYPGGHVGAGIAIHLRQGQRKAGVRADIAGAAGDQNHGFEGCGQD